MHTEPSEMLTEFVALRTTSVDEFHACMVGEEGGFDERKVASGPVELELRRVGLGPLEIGLAYSSVSMSVARKRESSDDFLLQFPLVGGFEISIASQVYRVRPKQGLVISPGQEVSRSADAGWILVFRIPVELLRERLELRLGKSTRKQLVFSPPVEHAANEILNYGLLAVEGIDRGLIDPQSAAGDTLGIGLVDLLLVLQPHNYGELLANSSVTKRADRMRCVTEFVDANLQDSLSVRMMADAVGCSARTLQKTLVELHGMTPVEFVRSRRMAFARRQLLAADSTQSVHAVARQVGYSNPARFSEYYKQAFGELPSETLRNSKAALR